MVAIYIPPLNVAGGEDVANVLAAVGEQSDKPIVSTFLGAEGVPELLRVPDVAGSSAGRGSVPSYPAVEAAVRALARVVEYAVWLRVPQTTARRAEALDDRDAARHLVNELLMNHPDGRDLDFDEQYASCSPPTASTCGRRYAVATLDEAPAAGEALGWDVVLKATADHLRAPPDLAHVWRNIDTPDGDARRLAARSPSSSPTPTTPASSCSATRRPGVPVTIATMEDPLFGPVALLRHRRAR